MVSTISKGFYFLFFIFFKKKKRCRTCEKVYRHAHPHTPYYEASAFHGVLEGLFIGRLMIESEN